MKKLWMAAAFFVISTSTAAQDRFRGYSTMVVTTWATQCAYAMTPVLMRMYGYPPFVAQQMAAKTCACTIDHWRDAMPYQTAMALTKDARREKSEQYTLMCAQVTEEL